MVYFMMTWQGRSTPGAIALPPPGTPNTVTHYLYPGDRIISVQITGSSTGAGLGDVTNLKYFAPFLTAPDTIAQTTTTDLSTFSFVAIMERPQYAPILGNYIQEPGNG